MNKIKLTGIILLFLLFTAIPSLARQEATVTDKSIGLIATVIGLPDGYVVSFEINNGIPVLSAVIDGTGTAGYKMLATGTLEVQAYTDKGIPVDDFVLVIPEYTEETQKDVSSGSTGGSGGVGVVSDECFATIIRKETRDNDLRFGAYVPFYFTSDIPVYEVHVKGLKSDPDVAVRVELLNDISCRLTENPPGRIYKFVNIFSGIKQDGVKIAFKVESGWMTTGVATLMRWQDGAWKDLTARQTGTDAKYTYFEATTDGFSSFAIVEKETAASTPQIAATAAQGQPTEQVPSTPITVPTEKAGTTGFIPVVIMLLGLGMAYVTMKRRNK